MTDTVSAPEIPEMDELKEVYVAVTNWPVLLLAAAVGIAIGIALVYGVARISPSESEAE